jgi:pyruvate/2-oxoglutarate dehydrogenase complex dihydrolipoamide dehydrogenase (E3) component
MSGPQLTDSPFDRALVGHVHPPDWVNPEPAGKYHLVVIGAGTAGLVTAAGAAGLGARVALVERHLMGGDCLNVGCVPSKAVIASARAAAEVAGAGRFGVRVGGGVEVDFPAVMERMRELRAGIAPHDGAARFRDLGVDVFLGEARFRSPDAVEVAGRTLRFSRAVIATGGRPAVPDVEGLAAAGFRTNETVFDLTARPRRMAVLGAGPIGCELAQAFSRLGVEVAILHNQAQFLPREDRDAAEILHAVFRREGIAVHLDTNLERVALRGSEKVLTLAARGGERRELVVDEILVAVGRRPNVEGLGLELAGVEVGPRGVVIDDQLRTSNRRIFAVGDVALPFQFTHVADAAARIVIQNALFPVPRRLSSLVVPWATYTDPEIAHVGLYEEQAKRGIAVATVTIPFADVDRARLEGDTEGFVRVHAEARSGRILGATIVGRDAGDLVSEVSTAIAGGVSLGALSAVIHPYPTRAEALRKAGDAWNRRRLTARAKRLIGWFLAFRHG